MCLIAWSWQPGTAQPLLLLANRDEFYARPSQAMHWWNGGQVLAGRDLAGGGTWLGVSRSGRVAALTNYRDPANFRADAPSRGALVANFLQGTLSAANYVDSILPTVGRYNGFNLLVFDGIQLLGLESRHARMLELGAGIGAVSNADFFSPWPKLEKLRTGLAQAVEGTPPDQDHALWDLLCDAEAAPDELLPQTGIPLERERALSTAFIATPDYGTRASTLLKIHAGGISVEERRFEAAGRLAGTSRFSL
jgi:uncharacterized protein with NRDE domain